MSRYTADSRDRVRDAVDMVALVESKLELRRAGVNSYFGCCPFHEERTASFHVRPDEKRYHCFGCSEAGDPFDFVMQTEGLDFKGALESLADRFGVTLQTEEEDPEAAAARARRERLYSLLARATTFYTRYLWDAREAQSAREYLSGRGFTEQALREFRVGYAPSAWHRMLLASRRSGFSDEELLAAGLVKRSRTRPGQVYDFFRGQIMFPTADRRGRVRGFGARTMGEGRGPKYVNTPDGDVYHKREVLYGIDLARASAAKSGRTILVEGYTDVIAMHQAGVRNVVGSMGTALTEQQVRELERVAGVLELCLDADRAGQQAMLRAAQATAGSKLELRVVPLPAGADPAELIATEGAEAMRERVGGSVPFVVFAVQRVLESGDLGSAEGKDRALPALQELLAPLPPSALRDQLTQRIAGALELSEPRLRNLLAAPGGRAGGPSRAAERIREDSAQTPPRGAAPAGAVDQGVRAERSFLALCIALPQQGAAILAAIDPDALLSSELMRRAARHLAGCASEPLRDLSSADDELARTVKDLDDRAKRGAAPAPVALEHARLLLELARVDRAISRARAERTPGIGKLARERHDVLAAIHALGVRLDEAL
ncbi:MAG: DNA primase [Solirubrobacteraceae bacterium]